MVVKITRIEELTFAKIDQLIQIHQLSIIHFCLYFIRRPWWEGGRLGCPIGCIFLRN